MIIFIRFNIFLLLIFFQCRETTIYGGDDLGLDDPVSNDLPVQIKESAVAFPGAEGFGKDASGGRGGKIIFVSNLNDNGPGSFREACLQQGPRYILFHVSGNISLKSRLVISNGDLTIGGQSAPGDGICIRDYPVVLNASNIIIRFVRFRLGDEAKQEADALEGRFIKNIIIDHCSMSWSSDETASFYANENTSLQWCIISESLRNSVHVKGAHGYGGIWGGKKASFHHNLLAHHDSRNPRLGEVADDVFALTDLVDLRNNVIYNWGNNSCYGGEGMNVNIVNCYYKPGPATLKKERIIAIDKNLTEGSPIYNQWGKFFIEGNVMEGSDRVTQDNWTYGVKNQIHSKYGNVSSGDFAQMRIDTAHPIFNNVITQSAYMAYNKVLEFAGASYSRDEVDLRIIDDVKTNSFHSNGSNGSASGIIDSQSDAGGYPILKQHDVDQDSSGDGIPDSWLKIKRLDTSKNWANGHELSTGYENIEVYLNDLVSKITLGQK
ncbi:MAG: pectate lyase [Saprospiraceae bacterium]